MMILSLVLVLVALVPFHATALSVWQLQPTNLQHRGGNSKDNKEEEESIVLLEEHHLILNFNGLVSYFAQESEATNYTSEARIDRALLEFDLPHFGTQFCTLQASKLFPPELAARYPELIERSGNCNNGTVQMSLSFHRALRTSFSATFSIPNRYLDWFYVDKDERSSSRDGYVLYAKSSKNRLHAFSCDQQRAHASLLAEHRLRTMATKTPPLPISGAVLRIAIVANPGYVKISGDSKSSALLAIARILTRLNGIYTHELGVFFQLIPETDKLFCVQSELDGCDLLYNHHGQYLLDNVQPFIANRGVALDKYDLAHTFTTGSGGVATISVLCEDSKALGTTGMRTPYGDAFSVDYVAHEIGHQLGGRHSFKYCDGYNEDENTAVEPGGGSTIMAYAGICGPFNIQRHSDPYLHAINLVEMREYIHHQLTHKPVCGLETISLRKDAHIVISEQHLGREECQVPVGNFFMLTANATSSGSNSSSKLFYQWESMDVGVDAFDGFSHAIWFRSWKPRRSNNAVAEMTRYFPNLYYLTHNLQGKPAYRKSENLVKLRADPARVLKFRFLVRTLYNTGAVAATLDNTMLGDFAYRDYTVTLTRQVLPLKFSHQTRRELTFKKQFGDTAFKFRWNANGAGAAWVEILIAINTMTKFIKPNLFDSERDLKDLNWLVLGRVRNTGKAELLLPGAGVWGKQHNKVLRVSYMIRAKTDGVCAAFDFTRPGKLYI